MNRQLSLLTAATAGFLFAGLAGAQPIGTCTAGNTCSIETRLSGQNLCADGIDNDGNGLTNGADPHCVSEVLCQDSFDNDADGLTDVADPDCTCLQPASGLNNPSCTAGDFAISYETTPDVNDGCINSTDTVKARLLARATAHVPDRYDLGLWLALDGNSAKTGARCARQILQPVSTTVPDPTDPAGDGPFRRIDADLCGDGGPSSSVSIYKFPFIVELPCTDITVATESTQNGFIDLGQCGSWDNNTNTTCDNPSMAIPGTGSKCRCARGETTIPGPNVRTTCSSFAPTGLGSDNEYDTGETGSYTLAFSNAVTGCTATNPASAASPFGRNRCGTVGFLRFVLSYGTADDVGDFYYNNGAGNLAVPACPATAVVQPNGGVLCNDTANDRLIWAPEDTTNSATVWGVVGPNASNLNLPFLYTFTAGGTATVGITASIWWDDILDADTSNSITDAEAVSLTGAISQTCSDCGCSSSIQATPITLGAFRATPEGRGVRFDWSTETEVGNVGFNLYALSEGRKVKLNDEPIPVATLDSLLPQSYSVELEVPVDAEGFLLEDLDVRGKSRLHGPFAPGVRHGAEIRAEEVDWSDVRRGHGLGRRGDARELGRGRERPHAGATRMQAAAAGAPAAPATPIEIHVDRDGIHRVTYAQLAAAGFDLSGATSSQLALELGGVPVPIHVVAGTKFGPGSYFEFWGRALDTLYTRTEVYTLRTGVKKPLRAAVSTAGPTGVAPATYLEERRFERDRGYAFWSPAADPFFDTEMLVFGTPANWALPFTVDGYVPGAGPATLSAELYGGTSISNVTPDHHVEVLLNGASLGEAWFDGTAGVVFEQAIPDGLLADGANTLTLRLRADTGAPYDLVSIDHFTVRYPRAFAAEGGGLEFQGQGGRFEVGGLPSAIVVAYRRTGSGLTRLAGTAVVPDGGGFEAIVPGGAEAATYAVASDTALHAPAAIRAARAAADLLAGPASYLVLTHAAFRDGLGPLVAARTAQGYTVKVVDVEDVYARYSHGVFDAEAIRAYVADAYAQLGTRYVLLVGGDTYDYLDHLNLAPVSFVPSIYRATGDIVRWAPSDASYADVDGDRLQDLAIGRLPVRTLAELDAVIAKTLAYDSRAYLSTGIFAADYFDPGANEAFRTAADRLVENFPAGWTIDRIYLDQTPLADARARLFADIASGATLTQYVGHSGLLSWGSSTKPLSQHLFKVADVPALGNLGRPSIFAQLGCWNTYYVWPNVDSLGTKLLLQADRGAAAVIGAATLTQDANGNRFGALLAPRLAVPGQTIGDAIRTAKLAFANEAPATADLRDVLFGWIVLGDPTLRVAP